MSSNISHSFDEHMEITEEQRQRAEKNRLAALAKRKAKEDVWGLFKCRKISQEHRKPVIPTLPKTVEPTPLKFCAWLEICSPDSFSITPKRIPSTPYPGDEECFKQLSHWLSMAVPSHYTQNHGGGRASVYKLHDYDNVLQCLEKLKGIKIQKIPWNTLAVVQRLSCSFVSDHWIPWMPEHISDDSVDDLLKTLPQILLDALLPFQLDGVRFALRRGGRCLIADEMGLGKTIQAIAIACCFMNEGPILVVCPAILRYSWAEEIEHWLPICSATDIHLVFGHEDNPTHLRRCPRVVVISYTMLHRLRKSILEREWSLIVLDESHHVRCSKKPIETDEVKAILEVATKVKRKVLLSGTPSLSRPFDIFHQINILWPGLLGTNKYEFAKTYCEMKSIQGYQGKSYMDVSKGMRLEELNVLLKETVMIRRLKEHVLVQLPPKRRQIIRLVLKKSDIVAATMTVDRQELSFAMKQCTSETDADNDGCTEALNSYDDSSSCHRNSRELSYQELGVAKLSGFREWLSLHPMVVESECERNLERDLICQKMIIFAHHLKVLDGIQAFLCEKGIGFVRIDGNTLARDRQSAVQAFRSSAEIKIAVIGITAGGVGVDFSSAQNVVFLELPQSASEMLQAEDRAHRRGQTNAVNIYIFCAQDTSDETRWLNLNKSLRRVSSVMNGKYDAVQGIAVEGVSDLALEGESSGYAVVSETKNLKSTYKIDTKLSETAFLGPDEPETSNVVSSPVSLGLESVNVYEEISAEGIGNKEVELIQTDLLHFEGSKCCDLTMTENTFLNGEVCTSDSSNIASPEKNDGSKLNEGVNQMLRILLPHAENLKSQSNELSLVSEGYKGTLSEMVGDDASSLIPSDSLRFEVSKYTGRVHLYTCIPGQDLRPRPLFENFHPEELDSVNYTSRSKKTCGGTIKGNPIYKDDLLEFVKEWNNLRPIEKNKLLGKPLQLPLSLELYYLKESMYHGNGGLLKGGSNRRATPLDEISFPLPESAVWKIISLCSGYGRKEKQYTQGWTVTGDPLCKLCQTPCQGKLAKTPEYFEDLFCNLSCFKEYRTRTSRKFLREELFKIEHGVCRMCNLDCHKLVQSIRPLSVSNRQKHIERVAPQLASHKKLFDKLVKEPQEGNAWHADHIVAVHKGGGECSLDNMRTLCVACHKGVTAAQRNDQRLERKKAKEGLKAIMRNLKVSGKSELPSLKRKVRVNLETATNLAVDDELLFEVPGSAYTVPSDNAPSNSSNEDELLLKVPCSEDTEGQSATGEERQESSSVEDKLQLILNKHTYYEVKSTVLESERKSLSEEDGLLVNVPGSACSDGNCTVTESE